MDSVIILEAQKAHSRVTSSLRAMPKWPKQLRFCATFVALNVLLLLIHNVAASEQHNNHRQQHGSGGHRRHQQQTVQASPEAIAASEEQNDQQQQRVPMTVQMAGDLSSPSPRGHSPTAATTSEGRSLFGEYLSRGMFSCTTKYVGMLQKLNKLVATAHAEYTQCQKLMNKADREHKSKKLQKQLEMINELLLDR